ncbi:MAG: hypothetical protein WCF17_19790 [Terracidiphilus sp.]
MVLALAAAAPAARGQESDQPQHKTQITPGVPGVQLNHRLILKDGSYQVVRKYEIVGDRVRYISVERGGEWEELPASLVDWDATKKWERDHTDTSDDASPAMREAAAIDKEEADERQAERNRMPEVAKGLELPDEDSVFVLDTFQGTPELVELPPNTLAVDASTHHGLSVLNPLVAQRAPIELPGNHAKVHVHVSEPVIYLSLDVTDNSEHVLSHAVTVKTEGAENVVNGKHGAHSTQSGFVIVRVDERQKVRIIGSLKLNRDGTITHSENVIPTNVEVMPGKHWLKVTPAEKLEIGDYAVVEILSPQDISETVWDFRVNPMTGDNEGGITPIVDNGPQ